jgi:hypothetical protein
MRRLILSTCLFLMLRAASAQVVISEIMYDPAGPENTDEFVELFNAGSSDSVRFDGWSLGDGTGTDLLVGRNRGMVLAPGGYALVLDADYFGNSSAYDALVPAEALILTVSGSTLGSAGLSNSSPENVTLFRPDGSVEDMAATTPGNAPGHSDERIDPWAPGDRDNWAESRTLHGTPGFRNSVTRPANNLCIFGLSRRIEGDSTFLSAVVLNDGRADAAGFLLRFYLDADRDSVLTEEEALGPAVSVDGLAAGDSAICRVAVDLPPGSARIAARFVQWRDDAAGDDVRFADVRIPFPEGTLRVSEIMADPQPGEAEWIELVNAWSGSVDLTGWKFSDRDTSAARTITDGSFSVAAGGYAVLVSKESFVAGHPDIARLCLVPERFPGLNDDSDAVVLYDPGGKRIEAVRYRSPAGSGRGKSIERVRIEGRSDDPGNWHVSLSPDGSTPGFPNSLSGGLESTGNRLTADPNPFSPDGDGFEDAVVIDYSLPYGSMRTRIRIYDIQGRLIRSLKEGEVEESGGTALWDGLDADAEPAAIGRYIVYFEAVQVKGGRKTQSAKVIVLARNLR